MTERNHTLSPVSVVHSIEDSASSGTVTCDDTSYAATERSPLVVKLLAAGSAVARYSPLLIFFGGWEILSRNSPSLAILLPPPTEVFEAAIQLLKEGTLQRDILASLKRVFTALGFAAAIGFPLGIMLGMSKICSALLGPLVDFFSPYPTLGMDTFEHRLVRRY